MLHKHIDAAALLSRCPAGTAIGLNLLLGWPMLPCILLTSLDALLLLLLVPR
jgi:Mn2+/Fe2+ NRAMP family transporter